MSGAILAAIGFAVVVFGAVMVWRPMGEVFFSLKSGVLVGSYVEGTPPASLPEMHRELALHLGKHALRNQGPLNNRLDWFTRSLGAFVIEIGGLMLMVLDVAQ